MTKWRLSADPNFNFAIYYLENEKGDFFGEVERRERNQFIAHARPIVDRPVYVGIFKTAKAAKANVIKFWGAVEKRAKEVT